MDCGSIDYSVSIRAGFAMSRSVPYWRTLPFGEHRTWAQVLETERLERDRLLGKLSGGAARHLQSLQCRAVDPDLIGQGPPPAIA